MHFNPALPFPLNYVDKTEREAQAIKNNSFVRASTFIYENIRTKQLCQESHEDYLKITVTWNTELKIHIMYLPKLGLSVQNSHSQSDRYFKNSVIFHTYVKHT